MSSSDLPENMGPGDHFDAAGGGAIGHAAMVLGLVVDFSVLIFLVWWSGVFAGGFEKNCVLSVVF